MKKCNVFYCIINFMLMHAMITVNAMEPHVASIVERAKSLVTQYQKDEASSSKPIIAIAGGSSVGKSYFSNVLLSSLINLDIKAAIVQSDRFLAPLPLDYALNPGEFNNRVGCPVWQFDHRYIHTALKNIVKRDSIVNIPRYDSKNKVRTLVPQDFSSTDMVIFEGIYTLTGPDTYNLAQYSKCKIFMDAPQEVYSNFYIDRQTKRGSLNPKETEWDFEEDYAKVIAPTKSNADVILMQNKDRQYTLESPTL